MPLPCLSFQNRVALAGFLGVLLRIDSVELRWQRSEVQDLRRQICECANAHKAQALELELVHQVWTARVPACLETPLNRSVCHVQEIESFAALEERFEELQLAARRSDRVGEAISQMTLLLKSNSSLNGQHEASKMVTARVSPARTSPAAVKPLHSFAGAGQRAFERSSAHSPAVDVRV